MAYLRKVDRKSVRLAIKKTAATPCSGFRCRNPSVHRRWLPAAVGDRIAPEPTRFFRFSRLQTASSRVPTQRHPHRISTRGDMERLLPVPPYRRSCFRPGLHSDCRCSLPCVLSSPPTDSIPANESSCAVHRQNTGFMIWIVMNTTVHKAFFAKMLLFSQNRGVFAGCISFYR